MADDDITLDGKPLQSLRVADLKSALEQRNLPKTGQKNALIKRLKGALMLENLQKSSSSHGGIQPNSQIGEEMSQNSFIQQYLAKQQELLRQRLEREAQQEEKDDECGSMEDKDHLLDSFVTEQSSLTRTEDQVVESFGHGLMSYGSALISEEGVHGRQNVSQDSPGSMIQHASFYQRQQELPAPSPPRAVASLSVRVLSQPERQGLPPAVSRMQEKANTAPCESTPPVLHLSRSAGVALAAHHEDSDARDTSNDESDDDDDWGPTASHRSSRVVPQPQPPNFAVVSGRSKRKLQPPQHIPPPQLHSPLQLRHPTPPPSPPPNLFSLPDTPKQSPPDTDHHTGEGSKVASFPPESMQREDSDSSSRSSSPEPPAKRRPGPLSLLVHKMESEQAFDAAQSTSAADISGEENQAPTGSVRTGSVDDSSLHKLDKKDKRLGEKEKDVKAQEKESKDVEEEKIGTPLQRQEKPREKMKEENIRQSIEKAARNETPEKMKMPHSSTMVLIEAQGSDSLSDSDSSSHSSSSSENKNKTTLQKADQRQKKYEFGQSRSVEKEEEQLLKREVSEPSAAAVTEEEPDTESSMALPAASGAEPENSEVPVEEVPMPLPLPLLVPGAYYFYHHHQHDHLLHSSSYSYKSCLANPKRSAGT